MFSEDDTDTTAKVPSSELRSTDLCCPAWSQTGGNQHDWSARVHIDGRYPVVVGWRFLTRLFDRIVGDGDFVVHVCRRKVGSGDDNAMIVRGPRALGTLWR